MNQQLLFQAWNFQDSVRFPQSGEKRGVCQGWNAEYALEKIWSVCVLTEGQRGVWLQPVFCPEQQLKASMEQILDLDKYQVVGCKLLAESGFRVITLKKTKKKLNLTVLFSGTIRHLTIGVKSLVSLVHQQGLFIGQVKNWLDQAAQILPGISSVFSIQFRLAAEQVSVIITMCSFKC